MFSDIANSKANLNLYGYTNCSPQWKVKEAGAAYHRLYYVTGGAVIYHNDNDGSNFSLERNCLYLFPTHCPYRIEHDVNDPLKCLWFHVTLYPPIVNKLIKIKVSKSLALYDVLSALEKLVCSENKKEELIKSLVHTVIMFIQNEKPFEHIRDERVMKVLGYIHENYSNNINNAILSKLIGLEELYFIRFFNKHFGVTPQRYVSSYRLEKACSLLMEGISVKEAAYLIGFQDTKSFSRFFKKNKGICPSIYKKGQYLQP